MTNDYWNLTGRISEEELSLYVAVFNELSKLKVPFIVIGATARDLVLRYFDVPPLRATRDIDFAIQIESWNEFEKIKTNLIQSGQFNESKVKHRFIHHTGMPVDILPFGGIADENSNIKWPPENTSRMNVLGFEEAYKYSQAVLMKSKSTSLILQFATPPGLVILKLISWSDDPQLRKRDARDILHLVEWYLDFDNRERLLEEHVDITKLDEFTNFIGAGRLLGRDIAKIVFPKTKAKLLEILELQVNDEKSQLLAQHMHTNNDTFAFESIVRMLKELKLGIEEG